MRRRKRFGVVAVVVGLTAGCVTTDPAPDTTQWLPPMPTAPTSGMVAQRPTFLPPAGAVQTASGKPAPVTPSVATAPAVPVPTATPAPQVAAPVVPARAELAVTAPAVPVPTATAAPQVVVSVPPPRVEVVWQTPVVQVNGTASDGGVVPASFDRRTPPAPTEDEPAVWKAITPKP